MYADRIRNESEKLALDTGLLRTGQSMEKLMGGRDCVQLRNHWVTFHQTS